MGKLEILVLVLTLILVASIATHFLHLSNENYNTSSLYNLSYAIITIINVSALKDKVLYK